MGLNSVHVKDVNGFKIDQLCLKICLCRKTGLGGECNSHTGYAVNESQEMPEPI